MNTINKCTNVIIYNTKIPCLRPLPQSLPLPLCSAGPVDNDGEAEFELADEVAGSGGADLIKKKSIFYKYNLLCYYSVVAFYQIHIFIINILSV